VRDAKCLQNRGRPLAAGFLRQMRKAVFDILLNGQMRKQGEILKHVSHAPLRDRHVHARLRIEQHAPADDNASGIRPSQSRNAIEQRRLARSGRTKQNGEPRCGLELSLQDELVPRGGHALAKPRLEQGAARRVRASWCNWRCPLSCLDGAWVIHSKSLYGPKR